MKNNEVTAAINLLNNRYVGLPEKTHAAVVVLNAMPEGVTPITSVAVETATGPATLVFEPGLFEIQTKLGAMVVHCPPTPTGAQAHKHK